MKLWARYGRQDYQLVKLGADWYRHHHSFKHKGFTVHFYFLDWELSIHWVNDYALYKEEVRLKLNNSEPFTELSDLDLFGEDEDKKSWTEN